MFTFIAKLWNHNKTHSNLNGWLIVTVAPIIMSQVFNAVLPSSFRQEPPTDFVSYYYPVAENMAQGKGFVTSDNKPATSYPPGFSTLIAGILLLSYRVEIPFDSLMQYLVLLCLSVSSIFLFVIAKTFWNNRLAYIPSLLWSIYPFSLWLGQQPNVELPFIVFLFGTYALFFYSLYRSQKYWLLFFLTGIVSGVSMLFRPIALGITFVFVLAIFSEVSSLNLRKRALYSFILVIGNLLCILPWQYWLHNQTGDFILLSTNGPASVRDGLTFAVDTKSYRSAWEIPDDIIRLMNDIWRSSSHLQTTEELIIKIRDEFHERPVTVIKLFLLKALRSWYGTDSGRGEYMTLMIQVPFLVLLFFGFVGSLWEKLPSSLLICVVISVLYFWFMTLLVLPILRYMVPSIGLGFLLVPGFYFFVKRSKTLLRLTITPERNN